MAITVQCDRNDKDARKSEGYSTADHEVFIRTFAVGCVVRVWERNGYDDSDFFATYWDESAQTFSTIEYATTRGWTYANGASVDASVELMAKYHRMLQDARDVEAKSFDDRLRAELSKIGLNRDDQVDFFRRLDVKRRSYLYEFLKKNVRSAFRKSIQEQAFNWLHANPSDRKYDFPLSPKQMQAIEPYGYHERKRRNPDLMSVGEILNNR